MEAQGAQRRYDEAGAWARTEVRRRRAVRQRERGTSSRRNGPRYEEQNRWKMLRHEATGTVFCSGGTGGERGTSEGAWALVRNEPAGSAPTRAKHELEAERSEARGTEQVEDAEARSHWNRIL